jgi:phenylalanyl-tRNA synthetase beta chain
MKISLEWLAEYVEFLEDDPQKIAAAITAHTAEVDEVEVQGALLDHCCVGKILTLDKHPNADKLQLCSVLTDKGEKPVVCGGANLRVGMRVAFAHVGASVKWHGEQELMTLEPIKIRGEQSEGMICAAEELDIDDLFPECTGHDIVDLGDGDENVGKPLKEVLGLDDVILHIDNHAITHRADLFSHIGFAMECAAIGIAKWKDMPEMKTPEFPSDPLPFNFRVTAEGIIPRYCACLLSIDNVGETPEYMKRRLAAVGIRSISLPIDITNYVMLEVGVPMHSFDADDIKGDCIARVSKEGEPLQTLDGQEWKLPEGALVFSDDDGNFDLVGIMGGLRSSTKETTKHIYLHALSLEPVRIRKTIIATGHRTDAATIYEKKVPHKSTEVGFYRALELFLKHVPGAKIISSKEESGDNGNPKPIKFSASKANSVLGAEIPEGTMKKIFADLGFTVTGDGEEMLVTAPLHRIGDITGAHDLIEEVGRIYGFNNIEDTMPSASIIPPERDTRVNTMRDALQEQGYIELLPLSLVGPDLLSRVGIDTDSCTEIDNAIGKETSLMAPSTLPALLEHAEKNLLQFDDVLRTFHVSTVFNGGIDSSVELGMLLTAKSKTDLKTDPFLLLKQELSEALRDAGYTLSIDICKEVPSYASAGRVASLIVEGKTVGTLFEVHPEVRQKFSLPNRVAALTLNVNALKEIPALTTVAQVVPEFPSITYDTTVEMTHDKSAGALLQKIAASSKLLESVAIADVYGKETGAYKLTLRCTYRSPEKTLTDEEVKKEYASVEKLL